MALVQRVQQLIAENAIIMFSKTTCPYCGRAKEIFDEFKVAFKVLELDTMSEGREIQDTLFSLTKQKTVPNIFIQGSHIGGCSDLEKLEREGKLDTMLEPLAQQ